MKKSIVAKRKSVRNAPSHENNAPSANEAHVVLSLFAQKRFNELEAIATAMTQHYPVNFFGWKVLGAVLKQIGRSAEALEPLQNAVSLAPNDAEAHNILGNTLKELGKLDAAVASYQLALEVHPEYAEAHNDLGIALRMLGDPAAAETSYRRAIEIAPYYAVAHNNLGNILNERGQLETAIASYGRALEIKPNYARALFNLGNVQSELGQLEAAVASYSKALEIQPDYAEAQNNLGATLHRLGQFDAAEECYRRALTTHPGYAQAHNNLGVVYKDLGQLENALSSHRRALAIQPNYAEAYSNLLFTQHYLGTQLSATLLEEARRFGALAAHHACPQDSWTNAPDPSRTLRVGLVSGDLHTHPVGYFIESVLAALATNAASRVEITAYYSYRGDDHLTERLKALCHRWHSVARLSDEHLAHRIRDDGVDILIDLSGHSARNRLTMFAWKPAPIQVSWLGYFATTGVEAIDYLIADPWTLPNTEEVYFTEKIWRLPETRLCFTPPGINADVSLLPAHTNGYITFGCFNTLSKMNDAVVALWARVLNAIPSSRLLLKAKQLSEPSGRQGVLRRFAAHGVDSNRLILEGHETREKYLEAYQRVDISLDTFPFPGGTTTVEGLWMGVPVLTLAGERFLARQGVGLLMNAGLPEWVANDTDDYVARAVVHASDTPELANIRRGLRQQVMASPLFDSPQFARHFEAALRGMWSEWCYQQQKLLGVGCKN